MLSKHHCHARGFLLYLGGTSAAEGDSGHDEHAPGIRHADGGIGAQERAISKAIRILEEGLSTSLDKVDGGELAQNLGALYDYCMRRLILANARNDDAMMQEVMRLIEPVAQGWNEIKKNGAAASAAVPATTGQPVLVEA